jgi:hypothetical protein
MHRAYALLVGPLLVLPGCQMNERMTGTAGGAVAGGLVSAVTGASAGSVLLVAGAGALVGYLIGDYLADQRERCMPAQPADGCCAAPAQQAYALPPSPPAASLARDARVPADPASGTSWSARVAYEQGRAAATAEEAEAAYADSIRLDPARPEPWNALALLALARGNRALARTHLVKSLELDPSYGPALHNLDRLDRGQ